MSAKCVIIDWLNISATRLWFNENNLRICSISLLIEDFFQRSHICCSISSSMACADLINVRCRGNVNHANKNAGGEDFAEKSVRIVTLLYPLQTLLTGFLRVVIIYETLMYSNPINTLQSSNTLNCKIITYVISSVLFGRTVALCSVRTIVLTVLTLQLSNYWKQFDRLSFALWAFLLTHLQVNVNFNIFF